MDYPILSNCLVKKAWLLALLVCSLSGQKPPKPDTTHNDVVAEMSDLPVIFIHTGYSDYLQQTLRQAKKFNKRVILISDTQKNCSGIDVEFHDIADYNKDVEKITKPYAALTRQKHLLLAIQRWFVIKSFMRQNKLSLCFFCDSDVLLYTNVGEAARKYYPFDLAITGDASRKTSCNNRRIYGGMSAFCTFGVVEDICSFLTTLPNNKDTWSFFKKSVEERTCLFGEMVVISHYILEHGAQRFNIKNLCHKVDSSCFDSFLFSSGDEKFDQEDFLFKKDNFLVKKLSWVDGCPYAIKKDTHTKIRLLSLHFHSKYKVLIPLFFKQHA